MRTNTITIQDVYKEKANLMSTITDEELFGSKAFQEYLQSIASTTANSAFKKKTPISVVSYYLPDKNITAFTDGHYIEVNTGTSMLRSPVLSDRKVKAEATVGVLAHELGHVLYNDFKQDEIFLAAPEKGVLYPYMPKNQDPVVEQDVKKALKTKEGQAIIKSFLNEISNVVDDGYVEWRISEEYPGSFKKGLTLLKEVMLSVKEKEPNRKNVLTRMLNTMLRYAKYNVITDPDIFSEDNEAKKALYDCLEVIDAIRHNPIHTTRYEGYNQILYNVWKYIDKTNPKIAISQIEEAAELYKTNAPKGNTRGIPGDGTSGGLGGTLKSGLDAKEEDTIYDTEENEEGDDENTEPNEYGEDNLFDAEEHSKALDEILEDIAGEKAEANVKKKREEMLQKETQDVEIGPFHKGIKIQVKNAEWNNSTYKRNYEKGAAEIQTISRNLQKSIKPYLTEKAKGGKRQNLLIGKRFDGRKAALPTDNVFYDKLNPKDVSLAVCVLIDQSGSMRGDKIKYALTTALVVEDFCRELKVPILVCGHHTNGRSTKINDYVEFDQISKNEKYSLMGLYTSDSNRDGLAVRYCLNRLAKRKEPTKLLIVISDGKPADYGYDTPEAIQDIGEALRKYRKKGIEVFAAAIDKDKDAIKEIYGGNYFLDITDIKNLPTTLTMLVKRHLN